MAIRNASIFLTLRAAGTVSRMPTRQILPACCARAASGIANAPPRAR